MCKNFLFIVYCINFLKSSSYDQDIALLTFLNILDTDIQDFNDIIIHERITNYDDFLIELCSVVKTCEVFKKKYLKPMMEAYHEIAEPLLAFVDACEPYHDKTHSAIEWYEEQDQFPDLYTVLKDYCKLVSKSYEFADSYLQPSSIYYKNILERKIKIICNWNTLFIFTYF